jgi:hypothetical protein
MFLRILVLALCAGIAQGASAQTAAPQATDTPAPMVSLLSLLQAGYDIKAVTAITEFTEMATWPGSTPTSPLIITLQKASSIAVCNVATQTWVALYSSALSDTANCYKR